METKDYAKMFRNIKDEILGEIRSLVPVCNTHTFKSGILVRYCEGEIAHVENCTAVEVSPDNSVSFIVTDDSAEPESEAVNGESIYQYDDDSFVAILSHLKKELRERREKKLSYLREIVKNNGGKIDFDGTFGFHSIVDGDHVAGEKSMLTCIELDRCYENRVYLDCKISGEVIEEQEENIPLDELDNLITYVERHSKRKFVVRVSGTYSRTFEIEAANFEEALEFAKTEWKEDAPLCPEDSNGEDWEDYTSVAH